jgi:hypothetical protein
MKLVALTLTALLVAAAFSEAKLRDVNVVYVCESKGAVEVDKDGKLILAGAAISYQKFDFEPSTGGYQSYAVGEHPQKFDVLSRGGADGTIVAVQRSDDGGLSVLEIDSTANPMTYASFSVGGGLAAGTCKER